MVPDCQSNSPSPGSQAWLTVASISHKWSRQVGALLNETQARSQSCWAKSKNKFLPDIKSNQEPLACCPSPACLPSFPCAVSCAVTPDLASLAQLFPSPNHTQIAKRLDNSLLRLLRLLHRSFDPEDNSPTTHTYTHNTCNMGQSVSWLSGLLWSKKEIRILILGLVRRPNPLHPRRRPAPTAVLTKLPLAG